MLALGNSRHSNARAVAHFRPAILSDRDTAWSVTWHFRSDLSVDRPLYWFLVLVFHRSRVIVQHISQVNMPFGTHKKILQIPIVFMAIVHIRPMIATS